MIREILRRIFPPRETFDLPPVESGGTLFAAVWECPTKESCDREKQEMRETIVKLRASQLGAGLVGNFSPDNA